MRIGSKGASRQGLAFAGTPRACTSGASTSRRRRREALGGSGGVSSTVREVRDGDAPRKRRALTTPKGARRSNRNRWKASRVVEACVRVTAARREIIGAGQANVARLRDRGRAQGTRREASEVKIATRLASEQLARALERSRRSGLGWRDPASPSEKSGASRRCFFGRSEHGYRDR